MVAKGAVGPVDADLINGFNAAVRELRDLTGKPCRDIVKSLLETRTLSELERAPNGGMSAEQFRVGTALLGRWIGQARERKGGDGA